MMEVGAMLALHEVGLVRHNGVAVDALEVVAVGEIN